MKFMDEAVNRQFRNVLFQTDPEDILDILQIDVLSSNTYVYNHGSQSVSHPSPEAWGWPVLWLLNHHRKHIFAQFDYRSHKAMRESLDQFFARIQWSYLFSTGAISGTHTSWLSRAK